MELFKLTEEDAIKAVSIPEDGMGYQWAHLSRSGSPESGVVISGAYFETLDDAPLLRGENRFTTERLDLSEGLFTDLPKEVTDLSTIGAFGRRSLILEATTKGARATAPTRTGTTPPHTTLTVAGDVFYRLSAFRADRRVLPNGSLASGSYSTTDTDITVVPSGLAAVGRYALPTRISAKYVFEIRPPPGTQILYGTVTPNYGLAGGGVEVLFPKGSAAGSVTFLKVMSEK